MANFDYLNWQTRVANGSVDTRSGAYDGGERGYYASNGHRVSQSTIDRNNDRAFYENNGQHSPHYHKGW